MRKTAYTSDDRKILKDGQNSHLATNRHETNYLVGNRSLDTVLLLSHGRWFSRAIFSWAQIWLVPFATPAVDD